MPVPPLYSLVARDGVEPPTRGFSVRVAAIMKACVYRGLGSFCLGLVNMLVNMLVVKLVNLLMHLLTAFG